MEKTKNLQDIENTIEDSSCGHEDCPRSANYTCPDSEYKLLCQKCKDNEYFDVETIDYHNPNDVSAIVMQIAKMVERISEYCNQLGKNSKAASIVGEIKGFQGRITKIEQDILSAIGSGSQSYRKSSNKFYSDALELKKDLFKTKMYESFKDLHAKNFVMNTSVGQTGSGSNRDFGPDIKVVLNQIQQFVGISKIGVQQNDLTLEDITKQMESIEEDAGSINSDLIYVAKSIIQTATSSGKQTSFNSNNSVVQALERLAKSPEGQSSNLSIILKNLKTLIGVFHQDASIRGTQFESLNEGAKDVDIMSMSSKVSSSTYDQSESSDSTTSEYAFEINNLINEFKSKVKLEQDEKDKLNKILKITQLQCQQLTDKIEELSIDNKAKQTRIQKLSSDNQAKQTRIKELEKLLKETQKKQSEKKVEKSAEDPIFEETKQAYEEQSHRVQRLEFYHEENLSKVLKDAKKTQPSQKVSKWICLILKKLTLDEIKTTHMIQLPFEISECVLNLDMKESKDKKLIKFLKYIKFPNLKKITIWNFQSDDKDVDSFLRNSFPDQLQYFYIKGGYKIKIGSTDGLVRCISKVTKEICSEELEIGSGQLNDIIKHAYKCPKVWISNCKISIDVPLNFDISQRYLTSFLNFEYTYKGYSKPYEFKDDNIITDAFKAIAHSSLKYSLSAFNICSCSDIYQSEFEKDAQKFLHKLGLRSIVVSREQASLECDD